MKKSFLLGLVAFFGVITLASISSADQAKFRIPKDVDGVKDVGGVFSGIDAVTLVTSTDAALSTDGAGTTITDGLVHWVVLGSTDTMPAGGYFLVLRATDTANLTSTLLVPPIQGVESSLGTTSNPQVLKFDPPLPFSNGLSVNIGPAGQSPTTIGYFGVGVSWKKQ